MPSYICSLALFIILLPAPPFSSRKFNGCKTWQSWYFKESRSLTKSSFLLKAVVMLLQEPGQDLIFRLLKQMGAVRAPVPWASWWSKFTQQFRSGFEIAGGYIFPGRTTYADVEDVLTRISAFFGIREAWRQRWCIDSRGGHPLIFSKSINR